VTISTDSDTLTLGLDMVKGSTFAKSKVLPKSNAPAGYAKTLASAYLKFTAEGRQLDETDSPQSFVSLYSLHNNLTERADDYLDSDVPFVYEGQPIQPLLLNFAAYLLTQASRDYLVASLQDKPSEDIQAIRDRIQAHQKEYDAILMLV
jgi:hypothetical protein